MLVTGLLTTATAARIESLQATLTGFEESPSVSTVASGNFIAFIQDGGTAFQYSLSYFGLQGAVTQGDIHVASPGVNGSIIIWLCHGTFDNIKIEFCACLEFGLLPAN